MNDKEIKAAAELQFQKDCGKRISAARDKAGLSTLGLAKIIGKSKGTVGHWETGKNAVRSPELAALCKALEVSADEILFGVRRWPFETVDFDAVHAMEPGDRKLLEGAMILTAAQIGLEIKREAA
jgi:transcriptional regulator with XRE-family HTH domain